MPDLLVITDVCLCQYTSHGHCGVVEDGRVKNDPTLDLLARTAVSQVEAGADLVAPSDMMDGRVAAGKLGWLDEERAVLEALTAIRRAGADLVITYFAKEVVPLLERSRG